MFTILSARLAELSLVLILLSNTLSVSNVITIKMPQDAPEAEKQISTEMVGKVAKQGQYYTKDNGIIAMIEKISGDYNLSEAQKELVIDLAWLESRFDPLARNPKSTAKGVFQWLDESWDEICKGDVWKAEDNIQCAIRTIKGGGLRHWTIDPNICSGLVNRSHIKISECAYKINPSQT